LTRRRERHKRKPLGCCTPLHRRTPPSRRRRPAHSLAPVPAQLRPSSSPLLRLASALFSSLLFSSSPHLLFSGRRPAHSLAPVPAQLRPSSSPLLRLASALFSSFSSPLLLFSSSPAAAVCWSRVSLFACRRQAIPPTGSCSGPSRHTNRRHSFVSAHPLDSAPASTHSPDQHRAPILHLPDASHHPATHRRFSPSRLLSLTMDRPPTTSDPIPIPMTTPTRPPTTDHRSTLFADAPKPHQWSDPARRTSYVSTPRHGHTRHLRLRTRTSERRTAHAAASSPISGPLHSPNAQRRTVPLFDAVFASERLSLCAERVSL
jgi:hypothetical protein